MKKLAIVNHNLGSGGAEKLIYDMALELHKKKIEFSVILLTSVNCIYGKKLLEKGVDVKYLSDKWDIYSPKNILRLTKILKDYDVVHTHIYSAQLWTAFSSYFLKNKKYITTEHNTSNNRRDKKIFKFLDKWMYSRYSTIVSITDMTEKSLKNWIGDFKNSKIIENGVNIGNYLNAKKLDRKQFGFKEKDILLCQIARFSDIKNHETTVKALKELPENYKVLFLGEGDRKNSIETLAKKLSMDKRIYFLGYRDDIPSVLKMCDISILTSKYEGLPISTIESMLLTPFIGSEVPGIKELVKDAGILFKLNDHMELKDKILQITEDKKLYEATKESCLKKALQFSIENSVQKYLDVYKEKR